MIELTKKVDSSSGCMVLEKIFLNPNKIVLIYSDNDGDTCIQLDKTSLYIEESVEVVISKIEASFNRGVK